MACVDDNKRKCFTFIWKLENVNYWWCSGIIESPEFTILEIDSTNWKLLLYFDRYSDSSLYLKRQFDDYNEGNVEIDFELACLSSDDKVLHSFERKNVEIGEGKEIGFHEFPSWEEVFVARRSVFHSQNIFTVRCRIWKSVGEIPWDAQLFARTCTAVEKWSFLWNIKNFSSLKSGDKQTYEIKSLVDGEQLMTLELYLIVGLICEERIRLKIIPNHVSMKTSILKLSIVDASSNSVKCFKEEFSIGDFDNTEFTLFYTKRELMDAKSAYLPNDVLTLLCDCSFCFETSWLENKGGQSKYAVIESKERVDCCFDLPNLLANSKRVLIDNLKTVLDNNILSDVILRTKTKTHPAHKCILSSRSPVFEAMFSNEMREKITDCVDIEDLNDHVVARLLRYIYNADVGDLEWVSATEMYEAADKYQVLTLKNICSSYIQTNLCRSNACDALLLADLHQDKDLKTFVQDFILRHDKDVMNSEEWDHLMKNNINLAAETMHRLYKK